MRKNPVKIYKTVSLQNPPLLVSWHTQDAGQLGSKVTDFLIEKLNGQRIGEIDPLGFFSFGGVRFKEDLVQVQESQFWACKEHNLLIFKSDEPLFEHYQFLITILNFVKDRYQTQELYTLSGAISLTPHTRPRRIWAVFNHLEMKQRLQGYGLENMTWEGPPAISSYLLWVARAKGVLGMSLWPEIPFYLSNRQDPQAIGQTLSFLDQKFGLRLDLMEWEIETAILNRKIAHLRKENSEIERCLSLLEKGMRIDENDQLKLTKEIDELFRERD
ncbi:MAG: PAC2 family protein [Thermodesulfobacteriota bacterium]